MGKATHGNPYHPLHFDRQAAMLHHGKLGPFNQTYWMIIRWQVTRILLLYQNRLPFLPGWVVLSHSLRDKQLGWGASRIQQDIQSRTWESSNCTSWKNPHYDTTNTRVKACVWTWAWGNRRYSNGKAMLPKSASLAICLSKRFFRSVRTRASAFLLLGTHRPSTPVAWWYQKKTISRVSLSHG